VLRQATLTNYQGYGMPADDPDVVRGRAGSLYAVRDAYDVCPDYAMDPTMRMQEFAALVDRLHAANLRVLIDLVPNHVARSYASVVEPNLDFGLADDQSTFFQPDNNFFYIPGQALSLSRPGWYNPPGFTFDGLFAGEDGTANHAAKVTGNDVTMANPDSADWYDTVKLNYGYDFVADVGDYDPMPDTWAKLDAIVAYWQDHGVDGFRCDHADMIPAEAWTYLIGQARARDPNVYFLADAETELDALIMAGFDAVTHHAGYDELKRLYQGSSSQSAYSNVMFMVDDPQRPDYAQFLEGHDHRRLASGVVQGPSPDLSGFGSKEAGYQLAPVAYLFGNAPILVYNGQEVGETGAGNEGFSNEDGRTSIYDYWSLEQLSKWVNAGAFDGGLLAPDQAALRNFYADLLALSQDPSALAGNYWGLEYFNNPGMFNDCPDGFYSFARFAPGSGRVLVVVANFTVGNAANGPIRLPQGLLDAAGVAGDVSVRKVLDRSGAVDVMVASVDAAALVSDGFVASVEDQTSHVFIIE
jgi:glycosidase